MDSEIIPATAYPFSPEIIATASKLCSMPSFEGMSDTAKIFCMNVHGLAVTVTELVQKYDQIYPLLGNLAIISNLYCPTHIKSVSLKVKRHIISQRKQVKRSAVAHYRADIDKYICSAERISNTYETIITDNIDLAKSLFVPSKITNGHIIKMIDTATLTLKRMTILETKLITLMRNIFTFEDNTITKGRHIK